MHSVEAPLRSSSPGPTANCAGTSASAFCRSTTGLEPELSAAGLNAVSADPAYSRAYGLGWRILSSGVAGPPNGEELWICPTWEIYERWCFVQPGNALRTLMPELTQDPFQLRLHPDRRVDVRAPQSRGPGNPLPVEVIAAAALSVLRYGSGFFPRHGPGGNPSSPDSASVLRRHGSTNELFQILPQRVVGLGQVQEVRRPSLRARQNCVKGTASSRSASRPQPQPSESPTVSPLCGCSANGSLTGSIHISVQF